MEHHISLNSLLIVVLISFIIPILLHKFKIKVIPIVVAEIIAGIIIGNSGFNLIDSDPWLDLLSLLGFIYLMFLSGLEIDFDSFNLKGKKSGPNPFYLSIIIFLLIFAISYGLSYLFVLAGFIQEPFLMTLIISTISLGIVVPVVKEKHLGQTVLGQTILLVAVVADFVTMILLAVFVAMQSENKLNSLLILVLFAIFFGVYRIIRRNINKVSSSRLLKGTAQLGTRGAFTLILLFVVLAETFGAESILGAFLAGLIISLLTPDKKFVHQLESFGYGFLIPIFFVMVGVRLEIWDLFTNPKIFLLIPLLLVALFISKIVPSLVLIKWFSKREVLASGFLLTSTLSLLIAAVTIALDLGLIEKQMYSALILVAIITSLIAPVMFNKIFPKQDKEKQKVKVSLIGSNAITLPISKELQADGYDVILYGEKQDKMSESLDAQSAFPLKEVSSLQIDVLVAEEAFEKEIIVISTGDDQENIALAKYAKEHNADARVIVRVEDSAKTEEIKELGIIHFSSINSTQTLLRALIDHPVVIQLFTLKEELMKEITMKNSKYDQIPLRKIPFLGDALIVRIFRNEESIIPHGDTLLRKGDCLLVSGSKVHIEELRREFS